jgi:hypothetical protein
MDGILGLKFIEKVSNFAFIVFSCYLPPVNSVYGYASVDFFNHLIQQLYVHNDVVLIALCGDFNGRIGGLSDTIQDVDGMPKRVYIDDCVQGHGEELLNFILDSKLSILNGRFDKDKDNFTYISDNGKSVVDYIFVPHECFQKCTNFEVLTMSDLLQKFNLVDMVTTNCKPSDHSILSVKLSVTYDSNERSSDNVNNVNNVNHVNSDDRNCSKHRKYFFDELPHEFMSSQDFLFRLNEITVKKLAECVTQNDYDIVYEEFCDLLLEEMDKCLKFVDIPREHVQRVKHSKPYWNKELYELWKVMREAESKFLKIIGGRAAKEMFRNDYVIKRKNFDKLLKKAEKDYNKKVINDIEQLCTYVMSKSLDPKEKTLSQ